MANDLSILYIQDAFLEPLTRRYLKLTNLRRSLDELKLRRSCADPENFVRGGPLLTSFFLRGETIQANTTINGPSSAFRWRVDIGPKLNAGLVTLWVFRVSGPGKKPFFFRCDFPRGGVLTPCPPSGSAHGAIHNIKRLLNLRWHRTYGHVSKKSPFNMLKQLVQNSYFKTKNMTSLAFLKSYLILKIEV